MSHDVTCTTCGSELKYVGDTLGSSAGFMSPRSPGQIRGDYELWHGNVCTSCKSVYCPKCIKLGPSPCPKCGAKTEPAVRVVLEAIGLRPTAETMMTPTIDCPVWRTIRLGLNEDGNAFQKALSSNNYPVSERAKNVLQSPEFTATKEATEADMAVVSAGSLGLAKKDRSLDENARRRV